jgi:hypothetical protein
MQKHAKTNDIRPFRCSERLHYPWQKLAVN